MASLATEALYAEQNFDGDKLAAVIHPQRALRNRSRRY
jgi:hypothetical protein